MSKTVATLRRVNGAWIIFAGPSISDLDYWRAVEVLTGATN